jgi:hypothetical protein
MDVNGFRMRAAANPVNLKSMNFLNSPTGGAGLNFDPVSIALVTVDSALFDVNVSTNVRAILDPTVIAAADINVIESSGAHVGPAFEVDPSSVVHWGTIGTPTGFGGAAPSVSSIVWSWTKVNHPLGFVVKSSTAGSLSPTLGPGATFWTEVGLSTDTAYSRYVEAFTDTSQAASSVASRFTLATVAANAGFSSINVSSVTITWGANGNPSNTGYVLERSTDNVAFTQIASGTYVTLAPYTDTALSPGTPYFYQIKSVNGNGIVVPTVASTNTTTLPVPPPGITAISPSTAKNLGKVNVTVQGSFFQPGATLLIKRSAQQSLVSTNVVVVNASTITATVDVTGALAGAWDVEVQNPDGRFSIGSGSGLFTVTDASSSAPVSIQNYDAASALDFSTVGNDTTITLAPAAMGSGRLYVSADPVASPLKVDPALITSANAPGLVLIPGSVREVLAFSNTGPFTSGFNSLVTLAINYPDQNTDGIVDNVVIRVQTLRLMTLNETDRTWQAISGSSVDTTNRRVKAPVGHFSIYALFGSAAAPNLSDAKIYPSPWKQGSGGLFDATALTISALTENGTIRIYSLDASLVKEFTYDTARAGVVQWDGRNSGGALVVSGVYLIKIESSAGEKKVFKVGVER